ncbi:uncharacterized protein [Nicotiana tomentosiformis]|uniref:uncharacterized protein n=1 Tax=Nicotiana tomentosiformis TaxID=4098 RepID=UPI00051C760C|nr:uncharacterized protein LOC104100118 [Nicotiana tomentosiformis]
MVDKNIIAADCIVICCCCQCLILQIIILFLLNLPCKLFKKTKECIKKLRDRRRNKKTMKIENRRYEDEILKNHGGSLRVEFQSLCCIEEVEKVLEEFSQNGEFAFGSFWGGKEEEVLETKCISTCIRKQTVDYDVFHTHLIQVFGSFNLQ